MAEPIKTERGTLVEMARIEGHGNPETGELWIRVVPTGAEGEGREDGVESSAQALARPGGNCNLNVVRDDTLGTNPNDSFEFYTLGNVAGAPTANRSSFDPGVCQTHLESDLAADPFYSGVLFPSSGTGCAYQRVRNFYSKRFERVLMDIDVWNGNYTTNGPYGPGFTNGTITTRPGRNAPSQSLGLWDFGPVAPRGVTGDTVDLWIFFKNAPGGGDFNFSGRLVGELVETCGDNDDDDCDLVNDNNCGNALTGDACFSDGDCAEGLACRGASIVSRQGTANGGTDSPGTCVRGPFGGIKLAGGAEHNCAVLPAGAANAGEVKCWGAATSQGTGSAVDVPNAASALPLELGGAPAVSVAAGFAHSCAVFEDGTVRCWGGNWDRQARGADGAAVMATAIVPLPLDVGAPVRQVVAGAGHTCVLRDDGGVRCFGANYNGECGASSGSDQLSLRGTQDVALGAQAVQLCAGEEHACALLDDGNVRCWGSGANGRLGYGNTANIGDDEAPGSISPIQILTASEISAGRTVKSIGCGGKQSCAILDDGGLRCWGAGVALGYDTSANLDKGDDELPSSLPTVAVGSPVRQVSIGASSTCALLVGGEVKCWGSTAAPNGCLGYPAGCAANLWQPPVANVNLGSGLTAIELSTRSTGASVCALLSNGTVKCWGANTHYQGGYGDTSAAISPPRANDTLPSPSSTVLDACTDDSDCSTTSLCHAGMCVSRGPLRVTLTWTSESDLDLFVTTPSAGTISDSNMSAGGGILDDDELGPGWNIPGGNHVENIAFPGSPPAGHYTFWALNTGSSSTYTLEAFYDGVLIAKDQGTLAVSGQTTHFEIQYPVLCGDGHVTLGEDCDADYGCSSACTVLPGFDCVGGIGQHSVCTCPAGLQDYDMNETCAPLGCGDGGIDGAEECDDGATEGGNGCSPSCTVEPGWSCIGEPSVCAPVCGDGVIAGAEECDDDEPLGGDGCSESCTIEFGYSCTGAPSDCTTTCGDGLVAGSEQCDDDDVGGNGCTACVIDHGYYCASSPSVCNTVCGDGLVGGTEVCDDNGTVSGNGCSSTCTLETGYGCTGEPSACSPVCGDGMIVGGEGCDDLGTVSGNGCSSTCTVESGYLCTGTPSTCNTVCGDGLIRGSETCDDQGTVSGNGCSSTCSIETGYACAGQPSACNPICGDGLIRGSETCDDSGTMSGNGCSSTCLIESGFTCSGAPSTCSAICGDGLIRGLETCDDGGTANGNGCSSTCAVESGYTCTGTPSTCNPICGDGLVVGSEACDDGSTANGNGCSSTCSIEPGFSCTGQPSACQGICGDTLIRGTETCDDGNTAPNDGCDNTCHIEPDCNPPLTAADYGSYAGTTTGAWDDYAGMCSAGTGEDVIYRFTAPLGGKTCFDTSGSSYDTQLHIQTTCADDISEIACSNSGAQDELQLSTTIGSTYYAVVDGNGGSGNYSFQVESGSCCRGTLDVNGNGSGCVQFQKVSMGTYHACGITTGGRLYCWGDNGYGQLGDGTGAARALPAPIGGPLATDTNWTSVTAGNLHTCAMRLGRIYCWGRGVNGQLGDNLGTDRNVPTEIYGGASNWLSVSAGNYHTCATRTATPSATLWCWGSDTNGQLGNGNPLTSMAAPVQVGTGSDWQSVSAGDNDGTCGIRAGHAYCWGLNSDGQLGIGSTQAQSTPIEVTGTFATWTSVEIGRYHTCGVRAGQLFCWGYGSNGSLGTGSLSSSQVPAAVTGFSDWDGLTVGGEDSCAWRNGGRLYCWGYNAYGEVGDGTRAPRLTPNEVAGTFTGWQSPSMGFYQVCAIRDGRTYCWGDNFKGQLGTVEVVRRRVPTEVEGAYTDWTAGRAGPNNGCGIRNGRLYCWGINAEGEVGDNSTIDRLVPTEVTGNFTTWEAVDQAATFACGIRAGSMYCWGANAFAGLGNGSTNTSLVPIVIGALTDWTNVSAGWYHVCAIRNATGMLYCWGDNLYGQLGVGTSGDNRLSPTQVPLTGWTSVATNVDTTCGIRQGRLYCWGSNDASQVGDGLVAIRTSPYEVLLGGMGYTDWQAVSAGAYHTCAMRAGRIYCWGDNASGQLGDGTTNDSTTLVEVAGTHSDWTELATGTDHTCGLRGGRPYCWGLNNNGQVGDGTLLTNRTVPTLSHGLTGWTNLAGGWSHTCALRGGRLFCWGTNLGAQLGLRRHETTPQAISSP